MTLEERVKALEIKSELMERREDGFAEAIVRLGKLLEVVKAALKTVNAGIEEANK